MIAVSVLLPVFNSEQFINESIDSILAQSLADFELILIDDGSTDRTVEIISRYSDPRIKLHRNNHNLGLIKTLNRGLELVSGKYIARMDADDVSEPERLLSQFHFMESNPEVVICGTNFTAFGLEEFRSNLYRTDVEIRSALRIENPFAHPTVMLRTDTIRKFKLKYREEFLHIEDWGLWLDLSKYGLLANLEASMLRYRMNKLSISSTYRNTINVRYENFFRQMYKPIDIQEHGNFYRTLTEISLAKYQGSTIREFKNCVQIVKDSVSKNHELRRSIEEIIDKKFGTLIFSIADMSVLKAVHFGITFRILKLKQFRYFIGKLRGSVKTGVKLKT